MSRLLLVPTLALLATAGCEAATTRQAPATSASAIIVRASADPDAPSPAASAVASVIPLAASEAAAHASASSSPVPVTPPSSAPIARASHAKPAPIADAGVIDAGDARDGGALDPALALARRVDGIFLANKTFRARFDQRYLQKITGTEKVSAGVVFVERPDKVSFRYDAPSRNRIVADGKTLRVYTAEDAQMFETPVDKSQYPGALGFMLGTGIASSFTFSTWQPPTPDAGQLFDGTILRGTPLAPNPAYSTVMFWIGRSPLEAREPGVIERVLVVDAQGNRNRFDFHDASVPAAIPASEFTFTPPPGTNVTR